MVALIRRVYLSFLVLLSFSFSFAHRFLLDTNDQKLGDLPQDGSGKGIWFGSVGGSSGVGVGVGSGSDGNEYGVRPVPGSDGDRPRKDGSGFGFRIGSAGSLIPGFPRSGYGDYIVALPCHDPGCVGNEQGNGVGTSPGSPIYGYGIEMGHGGNGGSRVPGIRFGQIGNGTTTKGRSASEADDEPNNEEPKEVTEYEAHESIIKASEPYSPYEAHEFIIVTSEPWSPHDTHESIIAATEPSSPYEAHESIIVTLEPWSPHEAHESIMAASEPWSP